MLKVIENTTRWDTSAIESLATTPLTIYLIVKTAKLRQVSMATRREFNERWQAAARVSPDRSMELDDHYTPHGKTFTLFLASPRVVGEWIRRLQPPAEAKALAKLPIDWTEFTRGVQSVLCSSLYVDASPTPLPLLSEPMFVGLDKTRAFLEQVLRKLETEELPKAQGAVHGVELLIRHARAKLQELNE